MIINTKHAEIDDLEEYQNLMDYHKKAAHYYINFKMATPGKENNFNIPKRTEQMNKRKFSSFYHCYT